MLNTFFLTSDKSSLTKREIIKKGLIFFFKSTILLYLGGSVLIGILSCINIVDLKDLKPYVWFPSNSIFYYFYCIIFGPFFEECAFRLGLDFKKTNFIIFVPLFVYALSGIVTNTDYMTYWQYKIPICLMVLVLSYFVLPTYLERIKNNFSNIIIIGVTIVYAFNYLGNYPLHLSYFPIYILFCLPVFCIGITLTYFRLNLGFLYCVVFHMLVNSLGLLIGYIIK